MGFEEDVRAFASRVGNIKCKLSTEESTKNSLIMPMLDLLGYNVFNPEEVTPEFTADFRTKQKEKVDYAIIKDGKPVMLIECKPCTTKLGDKQASQLYRYFSVCKSKIAILTNGLEYRFYSDFEEKNKMDETPFLVIDVENLSDTDIQQLSKFSKESFDTENIIVQGQRLKELNELIDAISADMAEPSEELIKYYTRKVYDGPVVQSVKDRYTPLIKKAYAQIIADRLSSKIKALQTSIDNDVEESVTEETEEPVKDNGIVTTEEELTGFAIVRAIAAKVCDINRIAIRDSLSYCAILFDDNNRKPVVRLHFNSATVKYVSTFDKDGKETKNKIEDVHDLYKLQDQVLEAISRYL